MKKILLLSVLLISITIFGQSFEGTVTWSVKYDVTDPAKKAEMEKAQKTASDPANQAKMKQLQEQMDKPEMKAMMDANPQMKAQMEKAMKMMQGGQDPMSAAMPQTVTVKIKGASSVSKIEGGMMGGSETLYDGDKKQSYLINRTAKTYTVMNATGNHGPGADSVQRKVTKTGETMKILDYTCTKYLVEMTNAKGTTLNQVFWTSTEVKGMDMSSLARQRMGSGQAFYYEGMTGMPLRIEMAMPQMNMIMEVTAIKKESLPAADFTVPPDFTESKGFGK